MLKKMLVGVVFGAMLVNGLYYDSYPKDTDVVEASSKTVSKTVVKEPVKTIEKEPAKTVAPTQQVSTTAVTTVSKTEKPKAKNTLSSVPKEYRYDNKKMVYLTFDDGPNRYTPELLNVLKRQKVRATFFVTGPNAKANPSIIRRMVKEGHTVGLHSMTHNKNIFYRSPQIAVKEMKAVQAIVYKVSGRKSISMRVPYGTVPYFTKPYLDASKKAGFRTWDWNIDSNDWRYPRSRTTSYDIIMQGVRHTDSKNVASVILMHDHATTGASLEKTIISLKQKGKHFGTVGKVKKPYTFRVSVWKKN